MKTIWKALLWMVWIAATVRAADGDTAAVMRQKLAASQRILGGLAVADFGLVQTNASALVALSGQRGWAAMQTPDYELFSTQFRVSSEALVKAAKVRDIDAAVGAYSDLTVSCVACHKYLRASPKKAPVIKP
ncbi:MAG: hypothetical protein JNL10_06030 [Verrucomicrobiales bacterium]|nr:hypothetical protein [Verrucomicrobiales bacterium]